MTIGQIKIIQHPTSQKQTERLHVEFSCKCEVPSGTQVLYQWFKDDQELEGKTSDTLLLDSVRMQDFGWYRCQVSCSGDTRMEPVKSGPAELNVTPRPGKSENYCFVLFVLFFVLYETQINEPLIWVCERKGKFLNQAKGLIYPASWCLYHEKIGSAATPPGMLVNPISPPPPTCLCVK